MHPIKKRVSIIPETNGPSCTSPSRLNPCTSPCELKQMLLMAPPKTLCSTPGSPPPQKEDEILDVDAVFDDTQPDYKNCKRFLEANIDDEVFEESQAL